MSIPSKQKETFLPSELFFLAEDTQITVIPRQGLDELELIGSKLPKLRAMRRVEIPLWTALLLKKQSRLSIVPPHWLKEEELKERYDQEVQNQDRFSELPWHWMEIGQAILDAASDDLESPSHIIRNLLRDLREIRQAKIRAGLEYLNESHMRMDNLGALELNEIRPFVGKVMDKLRTVHNLVQEDEQEEE